MRGRGRAPDQEAGWPDRSARRSLLAPLLAPSGLGLFAGYLWYRTGTPFASYDAQRVGWHQGDPITLLGQPIPSPDSSSITRKPCSGTC